MITHDLGVVAGMADDVVVLYAGQVMETAPRRALYHHPHHPYTEGLLRSLPRPDRREGRLTPSPGSRPACWRLPPDVPSGPAAPT